MKHYLLLSILFLSHHLCVYAQQTPNSEYVKYTQLKQTNLSVLTNMPKHTGRVIAGEVLMVTGGILMVVTTVGFASNQAATEKDASNQILFALVGVAGLSLFIPGAATYLSGLRAERRKKFTIISKRNQVGLAYNF